MTAIVRIRNKVFEKYIHADHITLRVKAMARQIEYDFREKDPIFLAVLNGAFFFAADLMREINFPCEISFVKVTSYEGMASSGDYKSLIGLDEELKGRHVIILEDIVDTGLTMYTLLQQLKEHGVLSVTVATMLFKRNALKHPVDIDYIGFEVTNDFLVGYGLDYERHGRNFPDILKIKS